MTPPRHVCTVVVSGRWSCLRASAFQPAVGQETPTATQSRTMTRAKVRSRSCSERPGHFKNQSENSRRLWLSQRLLEKRFRETFDDPGKFLADLSGTGDSQRDSRECIRMSHSQLKSPIFIARQADSRESRP